MKAIMRLRWILRAPLDFSPSYYLKVNPDVAQSGLDPYVHWRTHGKNENRKFSRLRAVLSTRLKFASRIRRHARIAGFDAEYYLNAYPDVAAAGIDPYVHFIKHGRAEGRPGMPAKLKFVSEVQSFTEGKKRLLFVSHEASRTGAPILSLQIMKALNGEYDIICLLLGAGELLCDFAETARVTAYMDRSVAHDAAIAVKKVIERFNPDFAIVNSVVSAPVLPTLSEAGITSVSLVHEFASYVLPRTIMETVVKYSTELVFSAPIILKDAEFRLTDWRSDNSTHILPQGRCIIDGNPETEKVDTHFRPEGWSVDTKIVLGAGSVGMRKGVDYFIQCAAMILARSPLKDIRFVWIGHGYEPTKDMAYSVYLDEQIRRSGLQEHFVIMEAIGSLEYAYQRADIFLLTSRLDPLPNVGIDCICLGLPILCFSDASGIADVLQEEGMSGDCVAPYAETSRMAEQAVRILSDMTFQAQLSTRLRDIGKRRFDFDTYVASIANLLEGAALSEKR